jgi:hypothetical protein
MFAGMIEIHDLTAPVPVRLAILQHVPNEPVYLLFRLSRPNRASAPFLNRSTVHDILYREPS